MTEEQVLAENLFRIWVDSNDEMSKATREAIFLWGTEQQKDIAWDVMPEDAPDRKMWGQVIGKIAYR